MEKSTRNGDEMYEGFNVRPVTSDDYADTLHVVVPDPDPDADDLPFYEPADIVFLRNAVFKDMVDAWGYRRGPRGSHSSVEDALNKAVGEQAGARALMEFSDPVMRVVEQVVYGGEKYILAWDVLNKVDQQNVILDMMKRGDVSYTVGDMHALLRRLLGRVDTKKGLLIIKGLTALARGPVERIGLRISPALFFVMHSARQLLRLLGYANNDPTQVYRADSNARELYMLYR